MTTASETFIAFEGNLLPVRIARTGNWISLTLCFPDGRKTDDIFSVMRKTEALAWSDLATFINGYKAYIRNRLRTA